MIEFHNTLYIVPTPVKPGESGINLEWHLKEGTAEDIHSIIPGCGCTADVTKAGTRITAVYTDDTKLEELDNYPNKTKTVSKNLRVFLNDGKPLWVKNARGHDTYNPDKASITLFFHCNVVS